ncbi:MAG: hypothetical protein ACU0CA_00100 [Paracoccaceae bacterium]
MDPVAEYQLVLALWGSKYSIDEVNNLIRTVRSQSTTEPRVVLITDRPREALVPGVIQRPFPKFFLQPEFTGGGCQAKLAIFKPGVVPDDLPAIYIDLDSVVMGDMGRFMSLQYNPKTIAILQSAIVPFGPIGRFIWRRTKGRRYARGNSSIIVYHPKECQFIAERFHALHKEHKGSFFRPLIADERFISWVAQPHMRAIPRTMAVKFPTEFMLPWRWLIRLRGVLPWNLRRWAGLIVVTLPGEEVKGSNLVNLSEGEEIVDRKGRRLIWSDRTLGPIPAKIIQQYRAFIVGNQTQEKT